MIHTGLCIRHSFSVSFVCLFGPSFFGPRVSCLQQPLRHAQQHGGAHHRLGIITSTAAGYFTSEMDLQYPDPIIHKPKAKHTASIFILHGLGDTGHGWSDLALEYRQQLPHVKWIFPNAPTRKITVNMGLKMPGWYDIISFDKINGVEDEEGLKESSRYIQSLIAEEVKAGIPAKRVLVCGFSQGGVMALMALREAVEVGGILGLSSYLPLHTAPTIVSPENKDTKVLMCHGTADPVVKYEYGQMSVEKLKAAGAKVDFKSYPGIGHSVCPEEMFEVAAFWMTCIGTA